MFERRTFLGSVIGLIAGTTIPFTAVEAKEGEVVEADYGELHKFRLGVTFKGQPNIWAPPLRRFKIEPDKLLFFVDDIQITKPMVAKGIFLYSPLGRICAKGDFTCEVSLRDGDVLKITYTVANSGNFDFNNWRVWEEELYKQHTRYPSRC